MVQHRFLVFFKRNQILFALVLGSALGIFQVRLVASAFLMNLEQIQVTRVLVQSDVYHGAECGVPGTLGSSRALLAMADTWNPNDALMDYRWGTLNWLEGKCDWALAYWQASANAQDSESGWASLALARGLYQLGLREQAVGVFRQSRLGTYLSTQALSLLIHNKPFSAIEFYELSVDTEPSYQALTRLSDLYIGIGASTKARSMWQQVIDSTAPTKLLYWLASAEIAALDQDWEKASSRYQLALAYSNYDKTIQFDLYLRLGQTLKKAQQFDQAIQIYEQAIQLNPRYSPGPYNAIALIRLLQGDYASASEFFTHAMTLFPGDPWAFIHAGELAARLGDPFEARRQFNKALEIDPNGLGALLAFGMFEYQQGNLRDAIQYMERANQISFGCDVSDNLLRLYQTAGETTKRIELENLAQNACPR